MSLQIDHLGSRFPDSLDCTGSGKHAKWADLVDVKLSMVWQNHNQIVNLDVEIREQRSKQA